RRRLLPRLPEATRIDTPDVVRRLKLAPGIGRALEAQVRRVAGPPTAAQVLDDWASATSDAALLAEATGAPARDAAAAADWCRARYEELSAFLAGESAEPVLLDPEDDALLLRTWQLRVGALPGEGGAPLRYRHVAI